VGSTRDEAEAVLAAHQGRLHAAIEAGVSHYQSLPPEHRAIYPPRVQSNIIHAAMVFAARDLFQGVSGVELRESRGQLLVALEDKLLIRLKKLTSKHRSSNIPTARAVNFTSQIPICTDEFFAPLTHVESGLCLEQIAH